LFERRPLSERKEVSLLNRRIMPMRSFNNIASIDRIVYEIIAYVLNKPQEVPPNTDLLKTLDTIPLIV